MDALFVLLAGLAVGGGAAAVTPPRAGMRAISLGVAVLGVAGLLVLLGAPEVAVLIAAVSIPGFRRRPAEREPSRRRLLLSTLLAALLLTALLLVLRDAPWPARAPADPSSPGAVLAALAGPAAPAAALALATLAVLLAAPGRRG